MSLSQAILDQAILGQAILGQALSEQTLSEQTLLYDASHWGRIEVSDSDRLNFLHNQSTNGLKLLKPGELCDTVFLNSTARTVDLATAYVLDESVLLSVSPGMAEGLIKFLDRYIFFADKVKLRDVTAQTAMLRVIGEGIGIETPGLGHGLVTIAGHQVRVARGCGLNLPGFTLICEASAKAAVIETLGLPICDEPLWERLRIIQGRPMPGQELTEDYNPLEAGLWQTISFVKGCYIGQETIARLDTYKGVKQQLWGFSLKAMVEPGKEIRLGEDRVGVVTSVVAMPEGAMGLGAIGLGAVGLGYVRTKAGGLGLAVTIAGQETLLTDLSFLTREKVG
jgi:tRNA-modifying protein YgfZ